MTTTRIPAGDAPLMERSLRMMQAFTDWSPVAMKELLASSRLGRHSRGDLLTDRGDVPEVFAIVTGHVLAASTSPGSVRAVAALLGPGLLVGLSRAPDSPNRIAYDFTANEGVLAVHMPTRVLVGLLDQDPMRWKDLGRMMLRQQRESFDTLSGQMVGAFPRRLAATVERLAALHGKTGKDGDSVVRLRVTQEDLAAILQVARQSVNKELGAWAASGVIGLKYNALTILQPKALRKIARQQAAP